MLYDFAAPSVNDGNAIVLSKYKGVKGKTHLKISNELGIERSHEIGRGAYRTTQQGDALRYTRSKIFKNWKDVTVIRGGQKILEYSTHDDLGMLAMALILAVPVLSFFIPVSGRAPAWVKARKLEILAIIPVIEFLVILFLAAYFFGGMRVVG